MSKGHSFPVLVASVREVLCTQEEQIQYETKLLQLEIEKIWPVGTEIKFIRRHGQTKPSVATVFGHSGGEINVTYVTHDRYRGALTRHKRIHWSSIVD